VVGLRTVETHVASVFTKLGLLSCADEHRRVRAVVTYLRHSDPSA
jgi:DNA-binding NarL/FixJ family response regulator